MVGKAMREPRQGAAPRLYLPEQQPPASVVMSPPSNRAVTSRLPRG
jgi:hypothetical protein